MAVVGLNTERLFQFLPHCFIISLFLPQPFLLLLMLTFLFFCIIINADWIHCDFFFLDFIFFRFNLILVDLGHVFCVFYHCGSAACIRSSTNRQKCFLLVHFELFILECTDFLIVFIFTLLSSLPITLPTLDLFDIIIVSVLGNYPSLNQWLHINFHEGNGCCVW